MTRLDVNAARREALFASGLRTVGRPFRPRLLQDSTGYRAAVGEHRWLRQPDGAGMSAMLPEAARDQRRPGPPGTERGTRPPRGGLDKVVRRPSVPPQTRPGQPPTVPGAPPDQPSPALSGGWPMRHAPLSDSASQCHQSRHRLSGQARGDGDHGNRGPTMGILSADHHSRPRYPHDGGTRRAWPKQHVFWSCERAPRPAQE